MFIPLNADTLNLCLMLLNQFVNSKTKAPGHFFCPSYALMNVQYGTDWGFEYCSLRSRGQIKQHMDPKL